MKPTTAVSGASARNVYRHTSTLADEARAQQFGHPPLTLWLTGLSGAGKSTLAHALEKRLYDAHQRCAVLDGDNLRHHLNHGHGLEIRVYPETQTTA